MGKVVYTTDVAHCRGRACPVRNKCYRCWLHQNNKMKDSGIGIVPYTEELFDFETEECQIFKPIE